MGEAGIKSWPLREEGTRLGSKLFSWSISWERRSLKKSRRVVSSTRAAEAVGGCLCGDGPLVCPIPPCPQYPIAFVNIDMNINLNDY